MAEVKTEQKNMYDHPIFSEPSRAEVKSKWEDGGYSTDDVRLYKAGINVKELGFFNIEKNDVKTLYKGGHIPRAMATEYKAFHERGDKPTSWSGIYMIDELAAGRTIEDVQKDFGGITYSLYDPIDLFIDVTTGGLFSGARATGKWGIKAAKQAFTKAGAKEALTSAGFGMVAGGGMIAADKLGGGTIGTLLAGLVSPIGVHALATMGRQAFIGVMRQMRKTNPKLAGQLKDAIESSEAKSIAHLRVALGELDEAEIGTTKGGYFDEGFSMGQQKIVDPVASQEAEKAAKGFEFSKKDTGQQIPTESLTEKEALDILGKVKAAATDTGETIKLYRASSPTVKFEDVFDAEQLTKFGPPKGVTGEHYTSDLNYAKYFKETYGKDATIETVEIPISKAKEYEVRPGEYYVPKSKIASDKVSQVAESGVLKQLGEGKGTDLAAAIHEIHKPKIEDARGGHVPRKLSEVEARKYIKTEYTKLAETTGKRVLDVEKALGDVKALQGDFKNVSAKITAFNDMYATILKEMEPQLAKTDLTFIEEVKLAEQIMGMAEFTEAIYGIRAEFGRGLGMYNRMFRKMPYSLDNIPQHEFEMLENATRPQIRKYLKAFKKAEGLKNKLLVARTANKYRFLKGGLEWMQGSLLWHVGTQGVNVLGNSLAYGTETLGRYAGVSYDAWKIAGGLRKPVSFDSHRMKEIYYDIISHKIGAECLFRNPKKIIQTVKAAKTYQDFAKNLEAEDVGSFWKALLTGEAQIDPFYKVEGQAGMAIENMFWFKFKNKTYKVPDALTRPIGAFLRVPFKGLTAMDEAFKTFAVHQKVSSELFRQGLKDGAVDMGKHIKTGIKNMAADDPMYVRALRQGRKQTFTEDLGETTALLEKIMNTGRFGLMTKIMALPFFKVIVNLNKYALKNTPLGFIAKDIREVLKSGSRADKAEVLAKMMMGTSAVAAGAMLYENGKITGRTPRSQYSAWINANKQAYSFISDNEDGSQTFTDYGRLDPYAVLIGVGADLALACEMVNDLCVDDKTQDEFDEALKDTIVGFGCAFTEPFLNKTFTKSANEVITAITNPERTDMPKFTEKQLRKFYPRVIDMYNQVTDRDDIIRDIRDPIDGFFAKLDPKNLPPKRHNVYGTIRTRDPRAFALMSQKTSHDPIMDEMMELGMNVRPFADEIIIGGEEKKLTPKQYNKLGEELEKIDVKGMLQQVIDDPGYQQSEDAGFKAGLLNRIIADTRAIAKAKFMESELGIPVTKALIKQLLVTEAAIMGKLKKPHKVGRFYKFLKKKDKE